MICPLHSDLFYNGVRQEDGSYDYVCTEPGHPGGEPRYWKQPAPLPSLPGISGLAAELHLDFELPVAVAALGSGWFELGLVEREYARRRPADFAYMVDRWGHNALEPREYTVTSYLGATLGRLSSASAIAYHPGQGTGRWSYNRDISWWSSLPAGPWEHRTAWVDLVGDNDKASQDADAECREYLAQSRRSGEAAK